jgi:hypothetical protein
MIIVQDPSTPVHVRIEFFDVRNAAKIQGFDYLCISLEVALLSIYIWGNGSSRFAI